MKNHILSFSIDLIALFLGASLAFAFAPYHLFPLAILTLSGLLLIWLYSSIKRAFWRGFLFGLGLFEAGVYWVFHSIHVYGGVSALQAGFITTLFMMVLALFPATCGYVLNRYFPYQTNIKMVCVFPTLWVLSECIRSFLFTGFPWLLVGYTQIDSPLKGFAPLLSVYGVSLATLISSGLIVSTFFKFKQKNLFSGYINLLALTVIWVSGGLFTFISWTETSGNPITVSLVQGNIPQELKWSPDHLALSFKRYESLTEPLWKKDNLIIWPEAALPIPLQDTKDFIDMLDEKAKVSHAHLILGIPIQTNNGYYNAIIPLGEDKKVYLKRHLVPFGEYTPSLPLLNTIATMMNIPFSNLIPGLNDQPPFIINHIKILPSICYEIAFPNLIYEKDAQVGFLLTVTNDTWFGQSSAQAQHVQMAAMRALELNRPLLFVNNNGLTSIISSKGEIESSAPTDQPFVLEGKIQPTSGLTPWMHYGDDPLFWIMIFFLVKGLLEKRALRKASKVLSPLPLS